MISATSVANATITTLSIPILYIRQYKYFSLEQINGEKFELDSVLSNEEN